MRRKISLNTTSVSGLLGITVTPAGAAKILKALGFRVQKKNSVILSVEAPSFRQDIKTETDLAEEVARIFGYENIPVTLPGFRPQITESNDRTYISLIKNTLVALGLTEVITYSLVNSDLLETAGAGSADAIEILNPLSKDASVLRTSIIPGLLKCIAYNLNQKQECAHIFEIANVFSKSGLNAQEEPALAIALCGLGLLHLKGILEALFSRLGIADFGFDAKPSGTEFAIYAHKEKIGRLFSVERNILDNLEIKNKDAAALELALNKLFPRINTRRKFTALPLYPGIARDISLVLKEGISAGDILAAIKEKAGGLLEEVKITDFYKGKQIPQGFKGLTISCLYRSPERTLTEEEISPAHNLICEFLTEKFGATIRQ